MSEGALPRVAVIVGPTAVGKTALSLALAASLASEIVSLDSRQLYRGMDIGTAKPRADELARVPHHLIDVADPDEPLTLSEVQAMALEAMADIVRRGRLPILVGGTGQYVRAVIEGWQVPRVPPDPHLRAVLTAFAAEQGVEALHGRLAAIDPTAAERIDPRNVRRVVRALEVHAATGLPISLLQRREPPPFGFVSVGLTLGRPEIYARIDRRIDEMLAVGLENEVRVLVSRGYGFDLPAMSGVGYGEWRDYMAGAIGIDEVVRRIRRDTRRLARHQAQWFHLDDPRVRWYDAASASPGEILAYVSGAPIGAA